MSDSVLHFRQPTQQEAFCHIYVPPELRYQYAEGLLDCPGLQGRLTLEMLRDFRAVSGSFSASADSKSYSMSQARLKSRDLFPFR